jgi:hypothetical protein
MKDLNLLVWLTQLGFSVAVPPAITIFLTVWLRNAYGWGNWIVWVGAALGIFFAIDGLRISLKTIRRIVESKKQDAPPPVSFNDHL